MQLSFIAPRCVPVYPEACVHIHKHWRRNVYLNWILSSRVTGAFSFTLCRKLKPCDTSTAKLDSVVCGR